MKLAVFFIGFVCILNKGFVLHFDICIHCLHIHTTEYSEGHDETSLNMIKNEGGGWELQELHSGNKVKELHVLQVSK